MPELRDSPFAFTRAQRTFAAAFLLVGAVGWATPYWLPLVAPAKAPAALGEAEMAAYRAEVLDWAARSDALADSLARERALRDSTYAARRAYYAERDRRWAERRERRPYANRGRADRYPVAASIPLPAPGSVDPNRADSATLRRLGLPPYVVSRLLKYRAKAGGFRASDDLARLYGLDEATFARVRTYLLDGPLERLARAGETADAESRTVAQDASAAAATWTKLDSTALRRPTTAPSPEPRVDVNEASEADLEAIRGIGPFYAKQILDYRDRLGGFVAVAQVAETPRLRAGAFEQWSERLRIAEGVRPIRPLRINDLDARALARHPYLPYSKAATLVAYREHHGPYGGLQDLYAVVALDSALVARLAPYLDFGAVR